MGVSFSRFRSVLKESYKELFSSKLNLFFMMFGLVVGIAAMNAIYGLGKGAEVTIVHILENLNFGANSFLVLAGGGKFFGPAATRRDRFKLSDVEAMKRLEFVEAVSPVMIGMFKVASSKDAVTTRVIGAFPIYSVVDNWNVALGRFITDRDTKEKSKVCVLGQETAEKLLGSDPLGKKIRINGVSFEVVGVLEKKGVIGRYRLDDRVIVPFTTAKRRIFNKDWIDAAKVVLRKGTDLYQAKEVVEQLLRKRHRLLPNEVNDFRIITPDQIVEFLTKATRTITALLLVISVITLVVSGVIIMNIMYAVVEEKKKIIALRKAYGATDLDILLHYTGISGGVSFLGGIVGYLVGCIIIYLVSKFSPIEGVYSLLFLLVGVAFSVLTGVLFGVFPARAAAKLPPADLLR
ncbi:ABC transport system permease [Thermosulfidibacter takaii ABI70S6]|uniref:ABC transport system permease n=1 Tax=Thermosulfidibacter takaii (strain DSM 17441 / JCM 13301 / NBRC 103674 / ABI70S6) TaxID=1298851 RepID=A0A0S3QV05_THET7|nr:ABC transporter permease [Thermosulfidibacter takaii]BAT72166.1 ABC transport system permease [Thermosulfidibacter takaii ABI70S6]